MKTINFELSKKLSDLWLLDDIQTEYIYTKIDIWFWNINYDIIEWKYFNINDWDIKTLTLEEWIKILPKKISFEDYDLFLFLDFFDKKLFYWLYSDLDEYNISFKYKETLLEAIEKMLEYLLDNNLLTK